MQRRLAKMPAPRPGKPVRGSRTGRPIMAVLDHLGRRWSLRIAWELREGPLAFRELQRRCGMASPNVLSARLNEATELGTVERDGEGRYALTRHGRDLGAILLELDSWADRWAKNLGASRATRARRARR